MSTLNKLFISFSDFLNNGWHFRRLVKYFRQRVKRMRPSSICFAFLHRFVYLRFSIDNTRPNLARCPPLSTARWKRKIGRREENGSNENLTSIDLNDYFKLILYIIFSHQVIWIISIFQGEFALNCSIQDTHQRVFRLIDFHHLNMDHSFTDATTSLTKI